MRIEDKIDIEAIDSLFGILTNQKDSQAAWNRIREKIIHERILTCVYCGHEYPQDTPAAGAQILTDHIKVCTKHPMRKAEATITQLRSALIGLVGASDEKELEGIEGFTRTYLAQGSIPRKDGTAMINAVHAILETKEYAALENQGSPAN